MKPRATPGLRYTQDANCPCPGMGLNRLQHRTRAIPRLPQVAEQEDTRCTYRRLEHARHGFPETERQQEHMAGLVIRANFGEVEQMTSPMVGGERRVKPTRSVVGQETDIQ